MIVIAQPSSASVGGSVGEPAGDEPLAAALSLLRSRCSVDLATPENPGELDGVLHRSGGRRIVVAGGDASMHAVVDALNRRNELADAVLALLPLDATVTSPAAARSRPTRSRRPRWCSTGRYGASRC